MGRLGKFDLSISTYFERPWMLPGTRCRLSEPASFKKDSVVRGLERCKCENLDEVYDVGPLEYVDPATLIGTPPLIAKIYVPLALVAPLPLTILPRMLTLAPVLFRAFLPAKTSS